MNQNHERITVKEVDLHITRECDNHCGYCYVAPNNTELQTVVNRCGPLCGDTVKLKSVITKIHDVAGAEDLVFVGGDPCKHPDLVSLLEHAKSVGLNTCVLSNTHTYAKCGTYYDIAKVARSNIVDELDFTLHGSSAEMHDAFTKRKGSYELATSSLKRFITVRKNEQPVGIVLNMVPDIVRDLPNVMKNIIGEIGMMPGIDFFTIQRVAPSGMALEEYSKWKLTPSLLEYAFEVFEEIKAKYGFETKCCIDAFPWCSVPEKYWKYLEPLEGGCNWGKPNGVLSALMDGKLQRCALCQSTLEVNILDMTPESFTETMLNHPLLVAVNERRHLDDKCLNCKLLDRCGGGCIVSAGAESGDPYFYEKGEVTVRKGHDYLAK